MKRKHVKLMENLPSEIIISILSRLPVRSIICCKCVCKSWLALLNTPEFVKSHLLNARPALVIRRHDTRLCECFEFEDSERHDLRCKLVTKFNVPHCEKFLMRCSISGLLLRSGKEGDFRTLYVRNPITREYIDLKFKTTLSKLSEQEVGFGFGSSRINSQHKVVWITQEKFWDPDSSRTVAKPEIVCEVYTIGTGLWRRTLHVTDVAYLWSYTGTFLNENLHWLVEGITLNQQPRISCFDLETEHFSTITFPTLMGLSSSTYSVTLSSECGCLCLCDSTSHVGVSIWLMKEYGVEKSWSKQIFISTELPRQVRVFYVIKVFEDGDVLMADYYSNRSEFPLYYSNKDKTLQELELFKCCSFLDMFSYTPSFLSLKSFGREAVTSY